MNLVMNLAKCLNSYPIFIIKEFRRFTLIFLSEFEKFAIVIILAADISIIDVKGNIYSKSTTSAICNNKFTFCIYNIL